MLAVRIFSESLSQRGDIQHRPRQEFLELTVLVLDRLQLVSVGHLHRTVAGAPIVERRIADPRLAAKLCRRDAGLAPLPRCGHHHQNKRKAGLVPRGRRLLIRGVLLGTRPGFQIALTLLFSSFNHFTLLWRLDSGS